MSHRVHRVHLVLALTATAVGACYTTPEDSAGDESSSSEASSGGPDPAQTTEPSEPSEPSPSSTDSSSTSSSMTDPSTDSSAGEPDACGNGVVDGEEACDDGNHGSADGCLSDCTVPRSCMDVRLHDAAAESGIHEVDSDGPGGYGAYEVYCDMEHAGGGWTLVIVSAEDGHDTWTWQDRELLTTDTFLLGNVAVREEDYKSAAHHLVEFSDLLFVHEPSGVWASYDDVGDGTQDVGTFMSSLPVPQCDLDAGYPMTDGELTQIGTSLCSTDLYFHAGDYDGSYENQAYCEAFTGDATATQGPGWSAAGNGGCPLDDPDTSSLGPSGLGNYDVHSPEGLEDVEWDGRGFANGMGLMQPGDRLEMYVR